MNVKGFLDTPLWDNSLSVEKRLDYLMEQLTLDEKFQCLGTTCPAIERLGIPFFSVGGEGAHGIQARHDQTFDKGEPQPTTIFPNPIGMSATWDEELIQKAGEAVGNEARALFHKHRKGGLCVWAPTVDMERDPRWGRTEEAYGEDPFLTGKMAASYVRGLKGQDPFYIRCGATLKHFYANNVEEGRTYVSSSVDPRNKEEYYFEPFRRCLQEGGAEAIMTSYNEINGVPAILNPEVQDLVKDRWGARHVVCDGGDMKQTVNCHRYVGSHVETIALGLKAGIDCFTDDLVDVVAGAKEAYVRGMITIQDIDRALRNYFTTLIHLGIFDQNGANPYAKIDEAYLNARSSQETSLQMARESVVLLKNDKQMLPLKKPGRENKLAVIGPLADVWYKDWYSGIPPYTVTPLEGLRKACGEENILYTSGLFQVKLQISENGWVGLSSDNKTLEVVPKGQAEIFELNLWDHSQMTLMAMSVKKYLTCEDGILPDGSPESGLVTATKDEAFGWFVKEAFRIQKEGDLLEVLHHRKPITLSAWNGSPFVVDDQNRIHVNEQGQQESIVLIPEVVVDGVQQACELAKEAEQVLFLMGPNPVINCKEEVDREDLDFPEYQESLLKQAFAVNEQAVLAMISNIPFTIRWEQEQIPGILVMASGSMEIGNALADVVLGAYAPAGCLNMTWYQDISQLPDKNDYDIIQNGRTYQYFEGPVLYPFGHGESYTTWKYENLQVAISDFTNLIVTLEVTNTGDATSDEVVQIYCRKMQSDVKRARRQLKGFCRLHQVEPGQTRQVQVTIAVEDLKYYDVISRQMILEPGEYGVEAGRSSEQILVERAISLEGVERGTRDGSIFTMADHYDRCDNIFLNEGTRGMNGACTHCLEKPIALEYDAVVWHQETAATHVCLDAEMKKGSQIEIWCDDRLVGSFQKKIEGREAEIIIAEGWAAGVNSSVQSLHGEGYGEILVPLTEEVPKTPFTLKITGSGDVHIASWRFITHK